MDFTKLIHKPAPTMTGEQHFLYRKEFDVKVPLGKHRCRIKDDEYDHDPKDVTLHVELQKKLGQMVHVPLVEFEDGRKKELLDTDLEKNMFVFLRSHIRLKYVRKREGKHKGQMVICDAKTKKPISLSPGVCYRIQNNPMLFSPEKKEYKYTYEVRIDQKTKTWQLWLCPAGGSSHTQISKDSIERDEFCFI